MTNKLKLAFSRRQADSGVDSELDDTAVDEQIAKLFENGRNKKDPKSLTPDPTRMPFAILSSSQLNGGNKDNGTNYLPNGGLNNRSTPKYLNHQDSGGNSQAKYKQALAKYDQNFADKFDNLPAANSSTPSNGSSLNEPLAPIPSSEQIFGRINELKQRFKNEIDQIKRQQQFSQVSAWTICSIQTIELKRFSLIAGKDGARLKRETERATTSAIAGGDERSRDTGVECERG